MPSVPLRIQLDLAHTIRNLDKKNLAGCRASEERKRKIWVLVRKERSYLVNSVFIIPLFLLYASLMRMSG